MEERFDRKFFTLCNGVSSNDGKRYVDIIVDSKSIPATEKQIISFIHSELALARKEAVEYYHQKVMAIDYMNDVKIIPYRLRVLDILSSLPNEK